MGIIWIQGIVFWTTLQKIYDYTHHPNTKIQTLCPSFLGIFLNVSEVPTNKGKYFRIFSTHNLSHYSLTGSQLSISPACQLSGQLKPGPIAGQDCQWKACLSCLPFCGAQPLTQHSRCAPSELNRGTESPPLTCWRCSSQRTPWFHWP